MQTPTMLRCGCWLAIGALLALAVPLAAADIPAVDATAHAGPDGAYVHVDAYDVGDAGGTFCPHLWFYSDGHANPKDGLKDCRN